MKKVGVVLLVLGIVCVVVGLFPQLGGVKKPAPGFGPQQIIAVIAGAVLVVVGLFLSARKCKCAAKEAAPPPAAPPKA